ncbi:MAG: HWE histidine kinase domain-containing protein [Xanthobacteraceae bacterium]
MRASDVEAKAKSGILSNILEDFPVLGRRAQGQQSFLTGGGELGERIRSFDWSANPLGPPENWPQSLKTAVRIMLTSRQPIWIGWGKELIYLYNDPYKSIIGGKHPWAIGRPTSEVWREIWSDIAPLLATAMGGDEGTYVEEQLLIMERNGYPEETYYTFSYSPIPNDDGSAGGIICANSDDTQRVIRGRELKLLRQLAAGTIEARTLQETCDRSAEALLADQHDLPFALIYLSNDDGQTASLRATTGIARGNLAAPETVSLAGKSVWPIAEALQKNDIQTVSDLVGKFGTDLPTGPWRRLPERAAVIPIPAPRETGRTGVLIVGLNPFRQFDETYRGFLGLVSGQLAAAIGNAQAYEEERRRAEALAELDRAKTAFFSNVSHEFRTPLTLMLGPLEDALAHAQELPPPRLEELNVAHRNALRLLRLVNSLLDFSRVESGRLQTRPERIDLAVLTRDIASNFHAVCKRAGLDFSIDCEPLSRPVYVDRDMWEKIVLNLISNAFKFTFTGGIEVVLREKGESAELIVRDTGVGIPSAELSHIFDRFHRVDGQRGRTHEGSGIGLALVRELVNLHGGNVRVESKIDQGTAILVDLPFGKASSAVENTPGSLDEAVGTRAVAFVEEAMRWLPDAVASEEQFALPAETQTLPFSEPADQVRPRLLIADDNADMRDYLRRLLASRYDVEIVGNGAEALHAARRRLPELLLTDVMMPVLDGFGLLREIRADPALKRLPVILLSARAGEEAKVEGLDAGADDYLIKPFSARELFARVNANIVMARLRRDMARELEAQKAQLQAVVETIPAAVWFTFDTAGKQLFRNRHASQLLRFADTTEVSRAGGPVDHFRVFQNDRETAASALPMARALRGETIAGEELEVRFTDGSAISLLAQANPMRNSAGDVIGAVSACIDITDRKRIEDHRVLLLNELNHRVKNTLATVQSIAAQSFRGAAAEPTARKLFESRLMALSRAHNVLTRENWEGAYLGEIVAESLSPYQGGDRGRFELNGPPVWFSSKMALAISMALHELATNASKYGALSTEFGRVVVEWNIDKSVSPAQLKIIWSERDGPSVAAPARKGFGSRLIERGLAQELGGQARIDYLPTGIVCEITAPLRGEKND